MFYGQVVCWVFVESIEVVWLGVQVIFVEYELFFVFVMLCEVIVVEFFQGNQFILCWGDVMFGFEQVIYIFEGEFEFGGQEYFYFEMNVVFVQVDENGQVFIQFLMQYFIEMQEIVVYVFGVFLYFVIVQCLWMGGGFGGKEMQLYGYVVVVVFGVVFIGCLVCVCFNWMQDLIMIGKCYFFYVVWKVGFDVEGKFIVL